MNKKSPTTTSNTFEAIKRLSEAGDESWSARELSRVLEYSDFRNFLKVIADARVACTQSGHPDTDHFVEFTDMVEIGNQKIHYKPESELLNEYSQSVGQGWSVSELQTIGPTRVFAG